MPIFKPLKPKQWELKANERSKWLANESNNKSFCDLFPPELRNEIYSLLFDQSELLHPELISYHRYDKTTILIADFDSPPILRTNKKINNEATSLITSHVTWVRELDLWIRRSEAFLSAEQLSHKSSFKAELTSIKFCATNCKAVTLTALSSLTGALADEPLLL